MHKHNAENREELVLASAMVYFVLLGTVTVAAAVAAHLH